MPINVYLPFIYDYTLVRLHTDKDISLRRNERVLGFIAS